MLVDNDIDFSSDSSNIEASVDKDDVSELCLPSVHMRLPGPSDVRCESEELIQQSKKRRESGNLKESPNSLR